ARGGARKLPEPQIRQLRRWNALDWALYSHFNRSFLRAAEEFGAERLREEAAALRERRKVLAALCLRGGRPVRGADIAERSLRPFQPPGGGEIMGFELREGLSGKDREMCGRMALPELPYKDLLERRQFGVRNGSLG
ncbi:G3ST4 sulfotransferase, partial [Bombycilla garrulus]|nr:G3ST4 sulfotransferase [Bombycilla garrulus]